MKKISFLFFTIFITLYSCHKEPSELDLLIAKHNLVLDSTKFRCEGGLSEYLFKGLINRDSVCYVDGKNNYVINNAITRVSFSNQGSISTDPNKNNVASIFLLLGFRPIGTNTLPDYYQNIDIELPQTTQIKKTAPEMFLEHIKLGSLPILDNIKSDTTAFNIKITINYADASLNFRDPMPGVSKTYSVIDLRTQGGEQNGSFLKCTELERKTAGGKTYFDVTFELKCKLYTSITRNGVLNSFYSNLEGTFRTRFDL